MNVTTVALIENGTRVLEVWRDGVLDARLLDEGGEVFDRVWTRAWRKAA